MGQLGFGVMINLLSDNKDSINAFREGINKEISRVYLQDKVLHFEFTNGYKMGIKDDGQSCCEIRYMVCDDDLDYYAGSILIGAELKEAPNEPDEYGDHEVQFLEIRTSKGSFTIASHNEHNGYYGGFYVVAFKE